MEISTVSPDSRTSMIVGPGVERAEQIFGPKSRGIVSTAKDGELCDLSGPGLYREPRHVQREMTSEEVDHLYILRKSFGRSEYELATAVKGLASCHEPKVNEELVKIVLSISPVLTHEKTEAQRVALKLVVERPEAHQILLEQRLNSEAQAIAASVEYIHRHSPELFWKLVEQSKPRPVESWINQPNEHRAFVESIEKELDRNSRTISAREAEYLGRILYNEANLSSHSTSDCARSAFAMLVTAAQSSLAPEQCRAIQILSTDLARNGGTTRSLMETVSKITHPSIRDGIAAIADSPLDKVSRTDRDAARHVAINKNWWPTTLTNGDTLADLDLKAGVLTRYAVPSIAQITLIAQIADRVLSQLPEQRSDFIVEECISGLANAALSSDEGRRNVARDALKKIGRGQMISHGADRFGIEKVLRPLAGADETIAPYLKKMGDGLNPSNAESARRE